MSTASPARPATPVLAGFDPGPEIRRSVRGQERHRPRLRRATRDLLRFAGMSDPARARAALEERFEWLRPSLWLSPFYCASLRRAGLSPRDLRSLDDLAHFPLLDREALRDGFTELPAFLPGRGDRLRVHHSSGSTAQPVTVVQDDYDSVHMWAVLRFWLRWRECKVPRRPRVALLCTLPHGVEYETPLPALGGGTLVRISVVRREPAERLHAYRPHIVFTDPAGLHWLLGQTRKPRPRLVLSSAMHLAADLRRRSEAALGAPVVNYYSTSETGPIAWECHAGRFHVLRPDVWVESVAGNTTEGSAVGGVTAGARHRDPSGELVVTRLRPSVVPLLRYRTGDRGRIEDGTCRCGHRGPSITDFSGRRACLFLTPQGREVDSWQLAWVFQHHPLGGFRLTQMAANRFRLETVADGGHGLVARLEKALVSLGWDAPQLEVRDVAGAALAASKPLPFVMSGSIARPR